MHSDVNLVHCNILLVFLYLASVIAVTQMHVEHCDVPYCIVLKFEEGLCIYLFGRDFLKHGANRRQTRLILNL